MSALKTWFWQGKLKDIYLLKIKYSKNEIDGYPVRNSVQGADRNGIFDKFQTYVFALHWHYLNFLRIPKPVALTFDTTKVLFTHCYTWQNLYYSPTVTHDKIFF